MILTIEPLYLSKLIAEAVETGVKIGLQKAGILKPYMTQSEAFKLYGKSTVTRWYKEGLVKPKKDGTHSSTIRIERAEIEKVAASNNWVTYLNSAERAEIKTPEK